MKIQSKKSYMVILAAMVSLVMAGTASADVIADCTLDGYVAMGGMVCNNTNSYLLPGNPDSPPSGPMETFGYAFLKFDASDLPSSPVAEAYLELEVMAIQDGMTWPVAGTGSFGVYAVTDYVAGINSGTCNTFRSEIASTATDTVSVMHGTAEQFSEVMYLDVTDIVNGWISSGNNYGLVLASTGGLLPRLHSSEAITGLRPAITNVPEPTTMGLLACGIVGLLMRHRKA